MRIHGIRIYPQSVGGGSDDCSDFLYSFRPLAPLWQGHFFADEFTAYYDAQGREDPTPRLREQFGLSLIAVDIDSQSMVLRGDDFEDWGASMHFIDGAFLPIFRDFPTAQLIKRVFSRDCDLTSLTWPGEMRALLEGSFDNDYWELFTTERKDLNALISAHLGDPKLKIYSMDFDSRWPTPNNQELRLATLSDED